MPDENIPQTIATLEKIEALNLNVLFDSHAGPIENPREHIQTRINHLKDLLTKVRKLHTKGRSVPEIIDDLQIEGPWYVEMTEGRFGIDHVIRSIISDEVSERR
jgi:hypothetical protein